MSLLHTLKLHVQIADKDVCKNLDLRIEPGQIWGILGCNGIGKTTLLHTLAGLRAPQAGEVRLHHRNIQQLGKKHLAQKIAMLLQHHDDAFPATVFDTVLCGRHPHIHYWQWESDNDRDIARRSLQAVDMLAMADRQVNLLSGGERQRVAIASILTQDPAIFLLDEPNSHLDLKYQISLLEYLTRHAQANARSIVMSLHDINLAARFCSHILILFGKGKTASGPVDELLTTQQLEQAYGHPINATCTDHGILYWPG